ncbi:MAG: hypothetical protein KDA72_02490 [Planctomycetales bacterium]|nr:hypothetical protein [Planctomycetales bacterium]
MASAPAAPSDFRYPASLEELGVEELGVEELGVEELGVRASPETTTGTLGEAVFSTAFTSWAATGGAQLMPTANSARQLQRMNRRGLRFRVRLPHPSQDPTQDPAATVLSLELLCINVSPLQVTIGINTTF